MAKDIYSARRSMMSKIPAMKSEDLKKESEDLYYQRRREDEKLLDAYNRKAVKSKAAIRRAEALIKARNEAKKAENATA